MAWKNPRLLRDDVEVLPTLLMTYSAPTKAQRKMTLLVTTMALGIWMKSTGTEKGLTTTLIRLRDMTLRGELSLRCGNLNCTTHFNLEVRHGGVIEDICVSYASASTTGISNIVRRLESDGLCLDR